MLDVVTSSALATARVQRRMRMLFGVPAAIAVIVIGMSWMLAPTWGLTGVGLSWLIGQTVVAAVLLVQGRLGRGHAAAPATPSDGSAPSA